MNDNPKINVEHPPFLNQGSDERECPRCAKVYSSGYPDPCLGFIPGASEGCCGHGIVYHEEDAELSGSFDPEGTPYLIFPPDDPEYLLDNSKAHTDHIRVYFPRLTDPARVKAVALAISAALGRDKETIARNPHRKNNS